ncbi:Fe-S cluster assembly protein SufB [candidate division WWE3 bacterium RBG_19FT_COMBO_53_11]|uniref:Fe-S cluster assembly protein SufB n=1 Tax=candidate division WWE3 bacterium RBG_19FT_COMBO_53_11 TaxID=1802613 RepID=A0A1F4UIK6_UNCKA|nr:MAG: Fe-S cluster assembly protein SufB [candidate division WWE3 bacterium RBG_16_52_45]OGC44756.1 MAG: Fe-S cluster assembly protein SufB [candidate division WWE3 bacterium RBG_19FT_COMBO_53_11]
MKKTLTSRPYRFGFSYPEEHVFKAKKGLSSRVVEEISEIKREPVWMRDFRLRSLGIFGRKPLPGWGADLSRIKFDELYYYLRPTGAQVKSWKQVPDSIRKTYERIGVPQAERKYLAGLKAQYDSEVIYGSLREDLEKLGVIFLGMDEALSKYPDLVREYFGTIIPPLDNKFAALNSAVWSGGSFVYVPRGVSVPLPLQAYFRINARSMGQFERTLIIAEEGSFVHYVEGCTAPVYSTDSLHSAVVEIIVKKGARVRYTTIQNWSRNVYNLVTKRAWVGEDGVMEWIDGNLGSKVTMKYPSVYLMGKGARGEVLSLAYADSGQHQDAGAKAVHAAPYTSSVITSKSICRGGGRTSYRGLLEINPGAVGSRANVRCDALILDPQSRSDTYPTMKINEKQSSVAHEATVTKVGEEQLFYLQSRGLSADEAVGMVVNGFIEPIIKVLPLEYAVELNRLIELEMEGSVG